MTFSQFISILRARIWVFLGTFLATVSLAIGLSLLLPKQFSASTTVVVDFRGIDPVLGVMLPVQLMPGYLSTQVDIIKSHKVALDVVKALRVTDSPAAVQQWREEADGLGSVEDWFANLLLKKLDVTPSRESSVIEIEFTGGDPRFAAAIANAFAEAYQRTSVELRVEPARQSAIWFDERMKQLKKNLEDAQTKLNEYQREKGFTAQDERLDLETGRLTELSVQYTATQAQAADASSRERQLREYLNRGASPETIPDILGNPLIQNLKSQLSATEGRLQQARSQLGNNHPEVSRLEADLENQRAKLKTEFASVAASIGNAAKIAQKREAELRAALAEQKAKLLKGNQGRDQMQVLMKEVESAQRAYDVASQRSQQTNLESLSSQTNVSVLTKAVPPIEPSFPKPVLNTIISIVLGIAFGLAMAMLVEMLNRRVRSADELADVVAVPVLGVLMDDRRATRRASKRWSWQSSKKSPLTPAIRQSILKAR